MGWLKWLKIAIKAGTVAGDVAIKNPEKKKTYEAVKEVVEDIVPAKKDGGEK